MLSTKPCRLRDNVQKYGTAGQATGENIIRLMHFLCWITKATDTHSEYVMFLSFSQQQCVCKRTSIFCYTCIACLVTFTFRVHPHPLLVSWSRRCRAIPLLPLWAVRPVQSLSACTRIHFTFTLGYIL